MEERKDGGSGRPRRRAGFKKGKTKKVKQAMPKTKEGLTSRF